MSNKFDRRSRSLWTDVEVVPSSLTLEGKKNCDTVIIGDDIAGISTAYELAIKGLWSLIEVILLAEPDGRMGPSYLLCAGALSTFDAIQNRSQS